MKIAIVGAGAIGGYLGARLSAAGEQVTFIARNRNLQAIRENGFHLEPVVRLHFAQTDDLAHDLGVIALRLGLVIGVADIVGDALALFLKALDALDEEAQLVVGGNRFAHR